MGKNQDPGSGINIPDPQHWMLVRLEALSNLEVPVNMEMWNVPLTGFGRPYITCTGLKNHVRIAKNAA